MNKQIQIDQVKQILSNIKDKENELHTLRSLYTLKLNILLTPDEYKIGLVLREKNSGFLCEIVDIGTNYKSDWTITVHLYDENNEPEKFDSKAIMTYGFKHLRIFDKQNINELEITDIPGKCHLLPHNNIVFA